MSQPLIVRELSVIDYLPVWEAMKTYTDQRDASSNDELWLLEHNSVFTQGQAGKAEHVLAAGDIPIVQADRGGQVTYHGPGQLVAYVLFDVKRLGVTVRALIHGVEDILVKLLALWGIEAYADPKAPGVYVNGAKIAQVGMRIRKGCSFHGLSLNLNMDLEPFNRINPCGYAGLAVTQLSNISAYNDEKLQTIKQQLIDTFCQHFNFNYKGQVVGLPVEQVNVNSHDN